MIMAYKRVLLITIFFISTISIFADTDPFSRSFTSEESDTGSSFSSSGGVLGENPDVHPLISLDENQYIIKGVVVAGNNSLAIVSYPGGKDYVMREGDPLGRNMYTIEKISFQNVMLNKNGSEDVDLTVFNPVVKSSSLDD